MTPDQSKTETPAPVSSTPLLADHVARFMSYAYQRGRLDALGMPDGPEKEQIVKTVGELEAKRWRGAAEVLLSANNELSSERAAEPQKQTGADARRLLK